MEAGLRRTVVRSMIAVRDLYLASPPAMSIGGVGGKAVRLGRAQS
jgi:hypothetical protein